MRIIKAIQFPKTLAFYGRIESVAKLACGDMFGEIAFLRGTRRTRSVRSLKASVLLSFSRSVFEQLVFTKISR